MHCLCSGDAHLFQIEDDKLKSTLFLSSAIRVQLYLANYKLSVKAKSICPKFAEEEITTKGCYKCAILALLNCKALSTCDAGVVSVHFQDINVHTKAIRLTTEVQSYTIQFSGN